MQQNSKQLMPFWFKVVIVFFLGWVFIYADRAILNPVLLNIQLDFNLTNAQAGLINSMFFLTYALIQIPAGIAGDKISYKWILVPGFITFGISTALTGLAPTYFTLLMASALTGLAQGTFFGPQYALSSKIIPLQYRGIGSALINSGSAVGITLGFIASSYITLKWANSWRTPFLIFSIPTIIVAFIIWFVIKDYKSDEGKLSKEDKADKHKTKAIPWKVLTSKDLVISYVVAFCSLYGFFMALTWLPYFLQTERSLIATHSGLIASLIALTSIPAALFFGYISDKLKKRKLVILILFPLAALSLAMVAYTESIAGLIIALTCYGLTGKLALDPVLFAYVADHAPKEAYATVFGVFNFAGMSSSVVAPYVTGFIADKTGTLIVGFYVGAIILMLGFLVMLFADDKL